MEPRQSLSVQYQIFRGAFTQTNGSSFTTRMQVLHQAYATWHYFMLLSDPFVISKLVSSLVAHKINDLEEQLQNRHKNVYY